MKRKRSGDDSCGEDVEERPDTIEVGLVVGDGELQLCRGGRSKSNDDKSAVAVLKKGNWQERESVSDACHDRTGKPDKRGDKKLGQNSSKRQSSDARQLGCVFQDMTPPKSILRKGTDMPKPIQRVKFTKAIARHTKIRDQNPSLGYICPGEPHERSPNAPKFEDRSQEETEW